MNDGAAVAVLMSLEESMRCNLKPLAKIISHATAGVPPEIMGTGLIPAAKKAISLKTIK